MLLAGVVMLWADVVMFLAGVVVLLADVVMLLADVVIVLADVVSSCLTTRHGRDASAQQPLQHTRAHMRQRQCRRIAGRVVVEAAAAALCERHGLRVRDQYHHGHQPALPISFGHARFRHPLGTCGARVCG